MPPNPELQALSVRLDRLTEDVGDQRVAIAALQAQVEAGAAASAERHATLLARLDARDRAQDARGDGVWIPGKVVVGIVVAILSAVGIGVVGGATIAPAATGQAGP